MGTIDFKGLDERLLGQAQSLLSQWFPAGTIEGREFIVGDFSGNPGRSLKINLDTGVAKDFSSGEGASGMIAIYARINGLKQGEAAKALVDHHGSSGGTVTRKSKPVYRPVMPPESAGVPDFTWRGEWPSDQWEYRSECDQRMFYIARYNFSGGKEFCPWTWDGAQWQPKGWPAPRPLYGLEKLAGNDRPILIVEGEKACDAAQDIVGKAYVCMTWPGGAQNVSHADFKPIHGRRVLIWPDADDRGREAGEWVAKDLCGFCPEVKLISTQDLPEKWDAADARDDGLVGTAWAKWARERASVYQQTVDAAGAVNEMSVADEPEPALVCTKAGTPHSNIDNAAEILRVGPEYRGRITYDTFHQKIFIDNAPITELDLLRVQSMLQRKWGLVRIGKDAVHGAMSIVGNENQRNEVRDYLESLVWDGVPRLERFAEDALGAKNTLYEQTAIRNWFVSAIARIYDPGCQVDHMIVFKSDQGKGKTNTVIALGGKWYGEVYHSTDNKDFYISLQGKWICEVAELDSLAKRKSSVGSVKRAVSCRVDNFRPHYDRLFVNTARQCVFAGTTNEETWSRDNTGARRFWQIECGDFNLEYTKRQRDQLFAEAVALYKAGTTWHEMPDDETAAAQEEIRQVDPWEQPIAIYLSNRTRTTVHDVLTECLRIEIGRATKADQMRVADILRERLRWHRKKMGWNDGRKMNFWYDPKEAAVATEVSTGQVLKFP